MTNNNKNILNIDAFTKLIKTIQNFSNFKSYKILFLDSFYFFL